MLFVAAHDDDETGKEVVAGDEETRERWSLL